MSTIAKDVVVRQAQEADLPRLVELFDEYRVFYGQASDAEGGRAFLAARLAAGDSKVFVGLCGDDVCAFAQLYPSFSSTAAAPIWILNDLYVEESARKSGLATALLERADQLAVETGAHHLELATARDNIAAQELYEKHGWTRDEVFVHYYHAPRR